MPRFTSEEKCRQRARQLQRFDDENQQLKEKDQAELPYSKDYTQDDVYLANTIEPSWQTIPSGSLRSTMSHFRKNAKSLIESSRAGNENPQFDVEEPAEETPQPVQPVDEEYTKHARTIKQDTATPPAEIQSAPAANTIISTAPAVPDVSNIPTTTRAATSESPGMLFKTQQTDVSFGSPDIVAQAQIQTPRCMLTPLNDFESKQGRLGPPPQYDLAQTSRHPQRRFSPPARQPPWGRNRSARQTPAATPDAPDPRGLQGYGHSYGHDFFGRLSLLPQPCQPSLPSLDQMQPVNELAVLQETTRRGEATRKPKFGANKNQQEEEGIKPDEAEYKLDPILTAENIRHVIALQEKSSGRLIATLLTTLTLILAFTAHRPNPTTTITQTADFTIRQPIELLYRNYQQSLPPLFAPVLFNQSMPIPALQDQMISAFTEKINEAHSYVNLWKAVLEEPDSFDDLQLPKLNTTLVERLARYLEALAPLFKNHIQLSEYSTSLITSNSVNILAWDLDKAYFRESLLRSARDFWELDYQRNNKLLLHLHGMRTRLHAMGQELEPLLDGVQPHGTIERAI
ncbi:hypothetical protein NM208_g4902 [Fusarium decemcellulare]|uniref:Uncharacterized protein n=1 Tax=Fusarium decemcellulare TaxID=57161 RepID=A0ACC1SIX8_9HYPO|nr:hypothetical protein NM208_g4902 [Fusarium decemcellulare]